MRFQADGRSTRSALRSASYTLVLLGILPLDAFHGLLVVCRKCWRSWLACLAKRLAHQLGCRKLNLKAGGVLWSVRVRKVLEDLSDAALGFFNCLDVSDYHI